MEYSAANPEDSKLSGFGVWLCRNTSELLCQNLASHLTTDLIAQGTAEPEISDFVGKWHNLESTPHDLFTGRVRGTFLSEPGSQESQRFQQFPTGKLFF